MASDTLERVIDEPAAEEETAVTTPRPQAKEPEPEDPADDSEVMSDDPKRELRWGWIIAFLFFGVLVGFSLFARMDAAVYAQGAISVLGNRQAVQHRDGGVVAALHVHDGQKVKAGDILVQLAPADVGASVASMQSQMIGLEARRARLEAEALHTPSINPPAVFATLDEAGKAEAARALYQQNGELNARRTSLARQRGVLNQRVAQLNQQIEGIRGQVTSNEEQSRLIGDELTGAKSLAERGFQSQNSVRALERNQAALGGQRASLTAGAAQAQEQIGETHMQSMGLDAENDERIAQERREVETQLADITPKLASMRERLAGTAIRAPATGEVVGLSIFTVGGVIAPGQALMEIVPDAAPLVVEAQISPVDADDVQLGQETDVRLVAFRDRNLPPLKGEITRISADRLVDQKTGMSYFTAQVTVPASEFAKVRQIEGAAKKLHAGLPVEILIPLRKRTAFQYLMEPLTQAFWRSFREH